MTVKHGIEKTAVVAIPATCGELVQGTWQGQTCLVSCPIDRYSTTNINEVWAYVHPHLPAKVNLSMTTLVNGGPRYKRKLNHETQQREQKRHSSKNHAGVWQTLDLWLSRK